MFRRFADLGRVHFVGIGGAGMSGIAEILADYDLAVSGSDLALSETTQRLSEAGVKVHEGHDAAHVEGADLVVVTSAVPADNPEVLAARRQGITVVRRAEMLGELMRLKYGIAVAGTHGKTTTTSLIGTLLTETGFDPTVIVGGRLRVSGTGARLGTSDYMVAEADEYDRSFLRLQPIIAVVTSIDREHLDTYQDLEEIQRAFTVFAEKVPFFGEVVLCVDDPNVVQILPRLADRRVLTYGFSSEATLRASEFATVDGGVQCLVEHADRGELGVLQVPLPGRHNAQNALAAVAVGLALDLGFEPIAAALRGFRGVHRRFEYLGDFHGARVYDDYAHHPTEVAATLMAARELYPDAAVHAVFQPHLFSRTRDQADAFGQALLEADHAVVTSIYPSREAPLPGVDSGLVIAAAEAAGHADVEACDDWRQVPERLASRVRHGDVVLTMGAGDIVHLGALLVEEEAS